MANRTYYGLQTGAAFMSGMAESYNRSLRMEADIKRYETQMAYYARGTAYQGRREKLARERFEFEKEYKSALIGMKAAPSPKLQLKQIGIDKEPYTFDPTTGKLTQIGGLTGEVSLGDIYASYPQQTDVKGWIGGIGDDTLSQEQMQTGFNQRIADLESQGVNRPEAEASAKRELDNLLAKDKGVYRTYPREGFAPTIRGIGKPVPPEVSRYISELGEEAQAEISALWPTLDDETQDKIENELMPYMEDLSEIEVQEIFEAIRNNPANIDEILRRLKL